MCRKQGCDHPLAELPRVRARADKMDEGARVEVVVEMEKVQLLSDHTDHPGKGRADRVSLCHTSVRIQHISKPASDPMFRALDLRDPVAHGKEEGSTGQIARQQPEPII